MLAVMGVLLFVIVLLQRKMSDMRRESEERFRESEERFRALAAESLRENADYMEKRGRSSIDSLVAPLKMRIEDFNRLMSQSHTDASASRRSLADQIERLERLNSRIGEDARSLAEALKGNTRFQGRWGETVLESLLENAGLVKDINYKAQFARDVSGRALTDEEGTRLRPDMLLLLPDSRNIIIDSKTSLSAYLEYCSSQTREEADRAAKNHVTSVKRHIDSLSAKEYQKNVDSALGHVLMFIPNDAALILAINTEPSLPEYAMKKNVALVGPLHLMSMVQLVGEIWRKENQDRNAAAIARAGGLVYDAAAAFLAEMKNIGRGLDMARNALASAEAKLASGPRSLATRAERLRDLGVKTSKRIDPAFISEASEPGSEDRD